MTDRLCNICGHYGMILAPPERYDLLRDYGADLLRHGIPEVAWQGWPANSVLVPEKQDLLMRA